MFETNFSFGSSHSYQLYIQLSIIHRFDVHAVSIFSSLQFWKWLCGYLPATPFLSFFLAFFLSSRLSVCQSISLSLSVCLFFSFLLSFPSSLPYVLIPPSSLFLPLLPTLSLLSLPPLPPPSFLQFFFFSFSFFLSSLPLFFSFFLLSPINYGFFLASTTSIWPRSLPFLFRSLCFYWHHLWPKPHLTRTTCDEINQSQPDITDIYIYIYIYTSQQNNRKE